MLKQSQARLAYVAIVATVALIAAGCTGESETGGGGQPGTGDSWWAQAAEPYAGTVIRGVSESTPPSTYVRDVLAPRFEKETGIKVEFEVTSWDQMYNKAIKDMEAGTGIYDFVYIEQDIVYSYLDKDFLVNISQELQNNSDLASPDFKLNAFTSFIDYFKDPKSGDLFGVPMEAFIKPYVYRTDLFNDPKIKAAFKKQYGYDLKPATTFDQYDDIATFFTDWAKSQGEELWGTTVQAGSHPAAFYEMAETIWPSYGVYDWGINMDNWRATEANGGSLDSDQATKALEFWVGELKNAPPEAQNSTWDEVAASFAAGRAAQGWVYGENVAWIATDPKKSKVVGKVGVTLPPTATGVLQDAESGRGYIGYYDGGAFGIPTSSKNQEAALLWLQYIGQPQVQADWAAESARIVQQSTFSSPEVEQQDKKTGGYYTLLQKQGALFAGAPPFPFHADVVETILPYILKAISGEMSPEDALDQAAQDVDEELQRLGYGQ
jgi:multiple sugar transport system substrate-binding protein